MTKEKVYVVQPGFRYATIAVCHARVSMLPFAEAEYPDQHKVVYDGIAHGGACAGGPPSRGGMPRPG